MKILQIFNDTKNKHILRYIKEFETGINLYFPEITLQTYIISEDNEQYLKFNTSDEFINNINDNFDYIFIHSLPKSNINIYNVLIKNIKIKKILFCHYYSVKEMYNNFSSSYINTLFNSCHKICIYESQDKIYNEIQNIINDTNKLIQIGLVYNIPNNSITHKIHQISMISSNNLKMDFTLYLSMFNILQKNNPSSDLIYKIYGINKSIQTLGIENLFNDKYGKPSPYTNIDTSIIDTTKINIYPSISFEEYNKVINDSEFIVDFDNITEFNYTLLDMFSNNTVLVLPENIAKNIKINSKQTLYDLRCAIYVNTDDFYNTILGFNKYIKSKNSYLSLCQKTNKLINQLYNSKKYIEVLFTKIL